ncbi:WD40-repeat-containing domain protein [Pavlovales sp. CCMP2436]|nr:WD40-repeat-containing domain protein [Pavlovales sp. CCMP2436]
MASSLPRRLAGRLGGPDARLLRSPRSESPSHLRVDPSGIRQRVAPVVRARHVLRGTTARRGSTPAPRVASQVSILPRGQIPLIDETAYDDAIKHDGESGRPPMLEPLGDVDQDPAERSHSLSRLRRYRERLRGSKPHGGASVTALAMDRTEDEEALSDSLVSGGVDSSIAVHDMATGALLVQRHNAHGVSSVLCCAVLAVGREKRVVSGGQDGTLRSWRLADLQPLGEAQKVHDGWPILCVAVCRPLDREGRTHHRFVTSGQDACVILWELSSAEATPRPAAKVQCTSAEGRSYRLTSLAWHRGGEHTAGGVDVAWGEGRCFAGDVDGRILVWPLEDMYGAQGGGQGSLAPGRSAQSTGRLEPDAEEELRARPMRVHAVTVTDQHGTARQTIGAAVRGMAASGYEELLTVDEAGRIVSWWLVPRPKTLARAPGADGRGAEGVEVLFELRELTERTQAHGLMQADRAHAIFAVAVAPDGALLVTGGDDGVIRRWSHGPGATEVVTILNAIMMIVCL